ncbi:MAG: hypothetical protein ABUT20_30475 [Bacteroidota bacterium]
MQTFCTIITADHFPKAVVLFKSLKEFNDEMTLQVLVADDGNILPGNAALGGIKMITLNNLSGNSQFEGLYKKYAHINIDQFRWALKPLLLRHLIETGFNKVIFVDCDIFFVNKYDFLFDELQNSSVILTPHWQNINPLVNETTFISTFTNGIFNAGFIGVNSESLPALNWWAEACHFKMGALSDLGIQDDQKYLDIFPVYFEKTKILRHKGCNIAPWNNYICKRTLVNGQVLINEEFPIIFIHFNHVLIKEILKGHDNLLLPFLNKYKEMFEQEGFSIETFMKDFSNYAKASPLLRLKWKARVRTRIKRYFFRLAESI